MNKLAYGLLSLIAVSPCTGYDLTQRVQLFWSANHSQIYPLLAQLEENGYASFQHVQQTDKPDKKIYSITDKGKEALRAWLKEPTSPPVMRDEFSLKLFSLWLADESGIKALLEENMQRLTDKLSRLHKRLKELEGPGEQGKDTGDNYDMQAPLFGPRLLIERSIAAREAELAWCRRVLELVERSLGK